MSGDKDDGGAAFPESVAITPSGDIAYGMPGMTLRDWFAGRALASIIKNGVLDDFEPEAAARAYRFADAMIAERSK